VTDDKLDRGAALQEAREQKMKEAFEGQKFVIEREVHMPEGQVFQTPFGNKGRHGYVLKNVATGQLTVVGATVLKRISELYDAVELPEPKRKRRTKAQKAADDAAAKKDK